MTAWTSHELSNIGNAEELNITTTRRDGTRRKPVTIWVVRTGDDLYVRSVNGRSGSWFRGAQDRHEAHIHAGGVVKEVRLVETDDLNDQIDAAFRAKYRRHAASIVGSVITPQARPPRSSSRRAREMAGAGISWARTRPTRQGDARSEDGFGLSVFACCRRDYFMANIPASHRDLLQSDVAVLATIGPDGFPQVTALWFLVDEEGTVKLSLNTSRQKVKNLQRHPECALFLLDRANPYRSLEIRARAELQPDPEYAFADQLGRKYNADLRKNDRPGQGRMVVTLHLVKYNTYG